MDKLGMAYKSKPKMKGFDESPSLSKVDFYLKRIPQKWIKE